MLKKAAIVTGGVAAGMLALSPAAFAGDHEEDWEHKGGDKIFSANDAEENDAHAGLANASDNNVLVPVQACNNNVPVNAVLAIQVPVQDIAGVLGIAGSSDGSTASNDDSCGQEQELDD